jgi:hypothetical protein
MSGELTQGLVNCQAILDLYLRAPKMSDTHKIDSLHKKSTVVMDASVVLTLQKFIAQHVMLVGKAHSRVKRAI